ncbi:MAG: hypothetical protein IMF09_12220 [Proteobacteria bacterium]|nr:hypothetical protein [Pseudomonadota bacterium]
METFGLMGFIFGMSAMSSAIIGRSQLTNLTKELDELKQQLQDNGTIPAVPEEA